MLKHLGNPSVGFLLGDLDDLPLEVYTALRQHNYRHNIHSWQGPVVSGLWLLEVDESYMEDDCRRDWLLIE